MPMQDFLGSVRRSLVFKPSTDDLSGFVEKIGSSIRKSRIGMFSRPPVNTLTLPPMEEKSEGEPRVTASSKVREEVTPLPPKIRWKKGELIGCGAFGRVYMGMNCDSGELLAVKEVAITTNASSKKTQEYIQELEKEVNLLKNLSHPNIVRYLGTVREEDSLNILLEFVPGGSIASLLGNFGCFPESVIRMYTKQLLLGLEYLHKNKIMHRDIKGANILVDNNGCIKLADFGASKKVEALATITGAKSMKGTPYWMAPEVIVQSGHSYSADIWSVGCTIIEMATGKAPWSQQYQEVAALFHVGTTKAHPPIPDHLSAEAKDFLLKCFKEPELRPTASELLEHPFVTGECQKSPVRRSSPMLEKSGTWIAAGAADTKNSMNIGAQRSCNGFKDVGELSGGSCLTNHPEQFSDYESLWKPGNFDDDDMCRIDDDDDLELGASMKLTPDVLNSPSIKSFNPTSKGDSSCKFDESPELNRSESEIFQGQMIEPGRSINCGEVGGDFAFPREQLGPEDDDEVTESKIRAFLVEKAIELKKLQTPLYEFYNSLSVAAPHSPACVGKENVASNCNLPPKSKSPNRGVSRRLSSAIDAERSPSPGTCKSRRASNIGDINLASSQDVREILNDSRDPITPRFTEIQKKWKEELAQELERSRELLRLAGVGKTSSPKDRLKQKDRSRFASPGK